MSLDVELLMFYGGVWNSVPLFAGGGVKISWELTDEGIGKIKAECEIDNDSGDFDPSDPAAALYGKAGRNTPIRIRHAGVSRAYLEASSFAPDETIDYVPGVSGRRWVKLTAEGLSRRVGRWTDNLESPMTRTIRGLANTRGHWPGEDGREAQQLSATIGAPASTRGVTFGETESPAGAAASVKVSNGGYMLGRFLPMSTTAGWQVGFSMRLDAIPGAFELMFRWKCTNGYTWYWDVSTTSFRMNVLDYAGNLISTTSVTHGVKVDPTADWVSYTCRAVQNGGNVDLRMMWHIQDQTTNYTFNDSFAGTVGAPTEWGQPGNATTDGAWFGHVFAVTGITDDLGSGTWRWSFNGYNGESAFSRFQRVMTELALPNFGLVTGTSTLMGPQRPMTLWQLFLELCVTDDMIIYDERYTNGAMTGRTRRHLEQQSPAVTLTFPGDIIAPLRKRLDDGGTANRVTAKNPDGAEYVSERLTGPMNVTDDFPGVGEYKRGIDPSIYQDHQLRDRADWERAKGTLDLPRWESITVDMIEHPELVTALKDVNFGDRVDVIGLAYDTLAFMVRGREEEIGVDTYTVSLTVEPYNVWLTATYDDASSGRYDSEGTTLNASRSTTDTSFVLAFTAPSSAWSVKASSQPYDLVIDGEVVRVGVGGMGAVTGAGPYTQTATVTRSVNSVVKAHAAGAEIHVANPARYGWGID